MGLKRMAPAVVMVALGMSGCGGSNSVSRSASGSTAAGVSAPLRVYRVTLSGKAETPHGAPNGSGDAVIAIHRGWVVCWRFSHLHGFLDATVAHIHFGRKGKSGVVVVPLSVGSRLHHRGCVQASEATVITIERHPAAYYVNIHSLRFPAGAVRSQL